MTFIRTTLATAILLTTLPAGAEEAPGTSLVPEYTLLDAIKTGKPMTSFRLRYETVDQDGNGPAGTIGAGKPLKDAKGITLRSLIGWQTAPFHNLSFAAQLIDVSKLKDDFNDSTCSRGPGCTAGITAASNQKDMANYAKIVDPDYTGVNQLYLDWTGIKNTRVRIGRQQVNLDNVRFVGDIGFRQVMQVFDGISVLNKSIPDTEAYLAHFESVRQITTVKRDEGALDIANLKYRISPSESVVAYAYLSDFKDLGVSNGWFGAAGIDQSHKTFGARLDGVRKVSDDWKVLYTAEYAKQSDYQGGDSRIDAHYYKLGGGTAYGDLALRVDQELLSSNDGQFAFQTPFGTNHLFQGWVDKFLATPKEGIRDTFVTATYKIGDFAFFADYHWINSDEDFARVGGGTGDQYGKEWNVAATYTYDKNLMGKVEYGSFKEDDQYRATASRIRDTDKLWLTVMYTF